MAHVYTWAQPAHRHMDILFYCEDPPFPSATGTRAQLTYLSYLANRHNHNLIMIPSTCFYSRTQYDTFNMFKDQKVIYLECK